MKVLVCCVGRQCEALAVDGVVNWLASRVAYSKAERIGDRLREHLDRVVPPHPSRKTFCIRACDTDPESGDVTGFEVLAMPC